MRTLEVLQPNEDMRKISLLSKLAGHGNLGKLSSKNPGSSSSSFHAPHCGHDITMPKDQTPKIVGPCPSNGASSNLFLLKGGAEIHTYVTLKNDGRKGPRRTGLIRLCRSRFGLRIVPIGAFTAF